MEVGTLRADMSGMSWRAKSSYFSHASSYRENVASARREGGGGPQEGEVTRLGG